MFYNVSEYKKVCIIVSIKKSVAVIGYLQSYGDRTQRVVSRELVHDPSYLFQPL
jgi:hypothetical protein